MPLGLRAARWFGVCVAAAATLLGTNFIVASYEYSSSTVKAASKNWSLGALSGAEKAAHETVDCVSAPGSSRAAYSLTDPQVAPPGINLSEEELVHVLNRSSTATIYHSAYGLRVPSNIVDAPSADVMKIVPTWHPSWPYLAIYHQLDRGDYFKTELAASHDLKTWQALRTVGHASSMPDIRIMDDGSLLFAHERNPSGRRPFIDVMYYTDVPSFVRAAEPTKLFSIPFLRGARAEGTPSFGRIQYNGDIRISEIEITYHYFENGINDQNAGGQLIGFSEWRSRPSAELNSRMKQIGYQQVGGRERFQIGKTLYELVEARSSNNAGWDEWRVFLVNRCTGYMTKLAPQLDGGAKSLGNPKLSFLRLPTGEWAIASTFFVFSEGAARTQPGTHLLISVLPSKTHVGTYQLKPLAQARKVQ